jgi:hypothetical protein
LNSSLGVGKDDCLLKVFQDNLVEVLLCSIHLKWVILPIRNA